MFVDIKFCLYSIYLLYLSSIIDKTFVKPTIFTLDSKSSKQLEHNSLSLLLNFESNTIIWIGNLCFFEHYKSTSYSIIVDFINLLILKF